MRYHPPPLVFEDGEQSRDFIHIGDIMLAFCLALECEDAANVARNGTGRSSSATELVEAVAGLMRARIAPEIVRRFGVVKRSHGSPDFQLDIDLSLCAAPATPRRTPRG